MRQTVTPDGEACQEQVQKVSDVQFESLRVRALLVRRSVLARGVLPALVAPLLPVCTSVIAKSLRPRATE